MSCAARRRSRPPRIAGKPLFDDPAKGNCARCHPDIGPCPAFTDFGFVALGVPARRGARDSISACVDRGAPTSPIARSTAASSARRRCATSRRGKRFFHNGSVTSLTEVVRFYATRDATPAKWVSDLPAKYRGNLDVEPPFGSKTAVLNDAEIADLVAFLGTLTDH